MNGVIRCLQSEVTNQLIRTIFYVGQRKIKVNVTRDKIIFPNESEEEVREILTAEQFNKMMSDVFRFKALSDGVKE
jgi:hypothetical protein